MAQSNTLAIAMIASALLLTLPTMLMAITVKMNLVPMLHPVTSV